MHKKFLNEALTLAARRRGFCAPNPAVGAILVKNQVIIGQGHHWAAGHPHAELEAIAEAGEQAKGATLYVTLEPCCHWGKTPPCTDAIIAHGIKEVYFGYADPNPLVAGKTINLLANAGIPCQQIALAEIDTFYRSYAYWMNTKKPWVTAKLALSLDGKIAYANGHPAQITGPELQQMTHRYRLATDAILTTGRTLNCDDPQLNVRLNQEIIAKPVYVLDRTLSLKSSLQIFNTASALTLFYHPAMVDPTKLKFFQQQNIRCLPISDLADVFTLIGEDGKHDVWVEAGGVCFNALWQQRLLHRALFYISLKTLGHDGLAAFQQAHDFMQYAKMCRWHQIGNDVMAELEFR